MEGHYRFTDTNNQFQSISIQLVDLAATQSQNLREEPKSTPTRVLTNEDLTTGKQIDTQPRSSVEPPSKPSAKNSSVAGPKKGESVLERSGQANSRRNRKRRQADQSSQ